MLYRRVAGINLKVMDQANKTGIMLAQIPPYIHCRHISTVVLISNISENVIDCCALPRELVHGLSQLFSSSSVLCLKSEECIFYKVHLYYHSCIHVIPYVFNHYRGAVRSCQTQSDRLCINVGEIKTLTLLVDIKRVQPSAERAFLDYVGA